MATATYRDDEIWDALRDVWSEWYDAITDETARHRFGRLSVRNRRMDPVTWEGGLVGWTQEALDDFVRAFCPSFKKPSDGD